MYRSPKKSYKLNKQLAENLEYVGQNFLTFFTETKQVEERVKEWTDKKLSEAGKRISNAFLKLQKYTEESLNSLTAKVHTYNEKINGRVDTVNDNLQSLKGEVHNDKKEINGKVDTVNDNFQFLKGEVQNDKKEINGKVDTVNNNLQSLKDEVQSLKGEVHNDNKEIIEKFDTFEDRLKKLEKSREENLPPIPTHVPEAPKEPISSEVINPPTAPVEKKEEEENKEPVKTEEVPGKKIDVNAPQDLNNLPDANNSKPISPITVTAETEKSKKNPINTAGINTKGLPEKTKNDEPSDLDYYFTKAHFRQKQCLGEVKEKDKHTYYLSLATSALNNDIDKLVVERKSLVTYKRHEEKDKAVYDIDGSPASVTFTERANGQFIIEAKGGFTGVVSIQRKNDKNELIKGSFDILRYQNNEVVDIIVSAPYPTLQNSKIFTEAQRFFARAETISKFDDNNNIYIRTNSDQINKSTETYSEKFEEKYKDSQEKKLDWVKKLEDSRASKGLNNPITK